MTIYAFESYVLIWELRTHLRHIWNTHLRQVITVIQFYPGPVYLLLLLDKNNKIGHVNLQ